MELKPGYKRTEAGIFPEDWLEYSVGDLIDFQGGSQPDKNYFSVVPKLDHIRLIQIRDYKTDKYATYIPDSLARRFCSEDDIMIGRYGPPVFQILRGLKGAYNVALIKAIPSEKIDKTFAYYFLKQEKLFEFIDKLSQRSSGQTGVDLKELKGYPLALPPTKAEQQAIAKALSDMDALIQSLEQQIIKKQQIKQGAMQSLLNPYEKNGDIKKGWEKVSLGNLCPIEMGQSPDSSCYNTDGVGLPLIQGNADIKNRRTIIRSYTTEYPKRCRKDDIIMTVRAPVGEIAKATFEACIGRGVCAIRPANDYLYHFLISLEPTWARLSSGSTFDSVNSSEIKSLAIFQPTDSNEQEQIANALTEIDIEISVLEGKLAKNQKLKQGMMQNLLTGTVRLV